jgi:hypothetical protein
MGGENLLPTGIQVLDHPALSELLYQLHHAGPHLFVVDRILELFDFRVSTVKIRIIHGVAMKCAYHDTKYSLEAKLHGVWITSHLIVAYLQMVCC